MRPLADYREVSVLSLNNASLNTRYEVVSQQGRKGMSNMAREEHALACLGSYLTLPDLTKWSPKSFTLNLRFLS